MFILIRAQKCNVSSVTVKVKKFCSPLSLYEACAQKFDVLSVEVKTWLREILLSFYIRFVPCLPCLPLTALCGQTTLLRCCPDCLGQGIKSVQIFQNIYLKVAKSSPKISSEISNISTKITIKSNSPFPPMSAAGLLGVRTHWPWSLFELRGLSSIENEHG